MSSYSELVKNFERVRAYMREFYVYGFKSREEYQSKSARSYDDERRRIESWLGDHMSFMRTADGKNVFISIDSRSVRHNPFYRAWKAKSFTDGDVTLHFILLDILYDPACSYTLAEILQKLDEEYLSAFSAPPVFDESTVRKKLKEYCEEGILVSEREGRRVRYRRAAETDVSDLTDALHLFSEVSPCGVIGSYILDKTETDSDVFAFKHHYMTAAMDSGVLVALFLAMRQKRMVSLANLGRRSPEPRRVRLVPLRVLISAQSGRQHLIAYLPEQNRFFSLRLDHISGVTLEEPSARFDELREELEWMQGRMWGVSLRGGKMRREATEHVEFTVRVEDGEDFIVKRLEREKRVGRVERIDAHHYRFTADVYDTGEMLPWIRTFICRIVALRFSNRTVENRFKDDLAEMYRMYGLEEGV